MDYYPRLFARDEDEDPEEDGHNSHDERVPCIRHNHVYTYEKALEHTVNRKRPQCCCHVIF